MAGYPVSTNERLPTLAPLIANPQVGSVGNSRRESTSVNGPADRFRHMLIGYARISTADQNPDHQIDALLRAGVNRDNIHVDTASGAKASRPKLDLVMQLLREGDTLKVTRLDRLSRSVLHLVTLGAELRERGIGLHVIEQGIDTSTMEGRAMFGMLSVLAELQRELIVANTNDGLASARARGRVGGRRPSSPRTRPNSPSSSTTPARRPSSRSPTSSACPAPRCTGTSTRPRPSPASRRRAPWCSPESYRWVTCPLVSELGLSGRVALTKLIPVRRRASLGLITGLCPESGQGRPRALLGWAARLGRPPVAEPSQWPVHLTARRHSADLRSEYAQQRPRGRCDVVRRWASGRAVSGRGTRRDGGGGGPVRQPGDHPPDRCPRGAFADAATGINLAFGCRTA